MTADTANQPKASDTTTEGVRVVAVPTFRKEKSAPADFKWVWSYQITITNNGDRTVKLLSRHWSIVDGDGERHDVRGEGVAGHQPELAPGQSFEYTSFCPLEASWGTMEGEYSFLITQGSQEGEMLDVRIGRFYLVSGT